MSKAPGAGSFNNPKRTGWLFKHGGSGISSHWKKRWFVADDHHLFYYKSPSDKKPVGILSMQEYGSCHKADVKEWKKPFTFVLERAEGSHENTEAGAGGKDYVLYSDSEEDMKLWIEVLTNEIKSSASCFSHSTVNNLKVDQKAIDEVTKAAGDGPKLTHLTTQRPRVKGRRPPKRYATYHEEDKDESPPGTPILDRKGSPVIAQQNPSSASSSPTSASKGHRPAVPLIPKQRSLTSSPPPTVFDKNTTKPEVENENEVTPTPKQRPVPPKRPQKSRAVTDAPVAAPRPTPTPRKIVREEPASLTPSSESEKDMEPTSTEAESSDSEILVDDRRQNNASDVPPTKEIEKQGSNGVPGRDINSRSHLAASSQHEHTYSGISRESTLPVTSLESDLNTNTSKLPISGAEYAVPSVSINQAETENEFSNVTTGIDHSSTPSLSQVSVESENEEHLTITKSQSLKITDHENSDKPFRIERDALGYAKVMKQKSNDNKVCPASPTSDEEPPPPPLWLGMDDGLRNSNVPSTLHQAREILHLAQVMKKEIEDMRREVQRELELARRERQDAELIKRNATEILKMAKQRLNGNHSHQ